MGSTSRKKTQRETGLTPERHAEYKTTSKTPRVVVLKKVKWAFGEIIAAKRSGSDWRREKRKTRDDFISSFAVNIPLHLDHHRVDEQKTLNTQNGLP